MAKIRTIKREFWHDEKIGSLPVEARLLYIGTWDTDGDAAHADGDRRRIGEDEQEPLAEREREADAGVGGEERIAADAERVGRNTFPLYYGGLEAARQAEGRAVEYGGANSAYYGWRSFHLNPRFVAEMMGFPSCWTESPFLRGERPR